MRKYFFIFFLLLSTIGFCPAQGRYDFGFERFDSIAVYINSAPLQYAWAGGMNSCHFSEVDLNLDGVNDLVVFEKHGNRILPFINNNLDNRISYTFAPSYIKKLPPLHDWVIFRDYDCDGKMDIFTYADGGGGIKVFRNISDSTLKFKLAVEPYLTYSANVPINIWLTNADYPVIEDMDNDGDLDILTFGVLGKYLIYYQNMAMERHGNCSDFDFIKADNCWGKFFESEASNVLHLNQSCSKGEINTTDNQDIKHTGSTIIAVDFNNDSIKDLVIGDVDYPNLIRLFNGGTKDSAFIIAQDTLFPSGTKPVHMFSFPSASLCDVNNDGKKDMLVSPYETMPSSAENFHSSLLYIDSGSTGHPVFKFSGISNFLQDQMIDLGSGAYPVFFDYDNDGLADLFVGNYGYYDTSYYVNGYLHSVFHSQIALFKNTGTSTSPAFTLINRDFAGVSGLKTISAYPAFADLDGDGDADMLVGTAKGKILYYENVAVPGNIPQMVLRDTAYQRLNPGENCTPQLIDLDRDGLTDLVCGKKNGKISYYRNIGSLQSPIFSLVTDFLGEVNVTNPATSFYGYSAPCFFEDSIGRYRLFVGTEQGNIFYYKNIDNNLSGSFQLADTITYKDNNHIYDLDEGMYAGVAIADINHDGYQDLIVGNYAGGLTFYKGIIPPAANLGIESHSEPDSTQILIYPNPANDYFNLEIKNSWQTSINQVELLDLFGNTLYQMSFDKNTVVNTYGISPGLYIIRLKIFYKNEVVKIFNQKLILE